MVTLDKILSKIRRKQYMSQKQYWKRCFFLHDNCMIGTVLPEAGYLKVIAKRASAGIDLRK